MKKIVFTFGRYNPPTSGHAELITYAVKLAHRTGAEHRIYTSQSHDPSKNPLSPREKMAFLRQIFPGVNFVDDPAMKTAFAICKKLTDEGYEDVTFVVGDDRVAEFRTQLGKYVKPRTAKDFNPKINYPFKKFQVVSSGSRKQGISGTDLRKAVRKGDFATFAKASAARDKTLARKIFVATKKNLAESLLEEKGISRKDFHDKLMSFIDFTCDHLGIDEKPSIHYKEDGKDGKQPSFASYSPSEKVVSILTKNRHPMDVFRSVAHELVHHKQNLDGRLGKNIAKEGATGSKIENEANSEAGKIMRYFGAENPFYFDMQYVTEQEKMDELDITTIGNYRKFAKPQYHEYRKYYTFNNEKDKEFVKRKLKNRAQGIDRADDRMEKWKEAQKPTPGQKRAAIWARKREMKRSQVDEEKAIILAGTPGSGKDKILKEAILPAGFTEINADEFYKKSFQGNVVVNGSFDYEGARAIKESLDSRGYETIMVFVNTSNEVSKQRNEARAGKGRVIAESIRFGKWKTAQDNLNKYDQLFEKVIEVKNDLDLNQSEKVIQETYDKLINSVSKEIDQFVTTEQDRRFQNMLEGYTDFSINNRQNPVGGAGNWGTSKLTDRYKADTPGQEPGPFKPMKVLNLKQKLNTEEKPIKGLSSAPIGGDRIGDEAGLPKGPGFGDNQSIDLTGLDRQIDRYRIDRWMQSEETKKRFRERYGSLSEQKMRETAAKLSKMESLDDPFSGTMASVSATTGNDDVRPNMSSAEQEKRSIFGKKKYKNTK